MTTKLFLKKSWKHLLVFLVGVFIGLLFVIPSCNKGNRTTIKKIPYHDTITLCDTMILNHTKIVSVEKKDTFYVEINKTDTDTIYYNNIPIELKEYLQHIDRDSASADVLIKYHGAWSDIDSISFIYHGFNTVITELKRAKKLGLDITVGPYVGYDPFKNNVSGGIGISIGPSFRITK